MLTVCLLVKNIDTCIAVRAIFMGFFSAGSSAGKSPKAKEITPPLALPNPKGIFSQLFNEVCYSRLKFCCNYCENHVNTTEHY